MRCRSGHIISVQCFSRHLRQGKQLTAFRSSRRRAISFSLSSLLSAASGTFAAATAAAAEDDALLPAGDRGLAAGRPGCDGTSSQRALSLSLHPDVATGGAGEAVLLCPFAHGSSRSGTTTSGTRDLVVGAGEADEDVDVDVDATGGLTEGFGLTWGVNRIAGAGAGGSIGVGAVSKAPANRKQICQRMLRASQSAFYSLQSSSSAFTSMRSSSPHALAAVPLSSSSSPASTSSSVGPDARCTALLDPKPDPPNFIPPEERAEAAVGLVAPPKLA